MKATHLIAILCVAFSVQSSNGQGIATLETNKTEYEYGEAIEIDFTLENPSNTVFVINSSSSCQAQFKFNDFESWANAICTTDSVPIMFSPGGHRTWSWVIEPREMGLPDSTGIHTIVGFFSTYSDTLQITAPEYIGGQLAVQFDTATSTDTLETIRSALNAVVVESYSFTPGSTREVWEIEGVRLEDAISEYGSHPAIQTMEINRVINYASIVNTEQEEPQREGIESVVYPNPFRSRATLKITTGHSQPVQVKIYDILGRERMTLYEGNLTGTEELTIDGSTLSKGIYFYKVISEQETQVGRFVYVE